MGNGTKKILIAIFLGVFAYAIIGGGLVFAQEKFPTRPISIIISWSAGGGQDLAVRALQPHLEKALGQSIILINKPGGGASIGFNMIANSDRDGYTIGQASPSINILKYTMKADVDYVKFEPVFYLGYSPVAIVVKNDAPWKTLKEFLNYAKANPSKLRVGNSGYGAIYHIASIGIEHAAGVKFTHIPFKGTGPSITGLLGGHIEANIVTVDISQIPLIKGGEIRALGVAAPERNKYIPEVQTFNELGMKAEYVTWFAWVVPKGTPKERVSILYNAFKKGAETKEYRDFCDKQGGIVISMKGPEEFANFLQEEDKKWGQLIAIGGIKPE